MSDGNAEAHACICNNGIRLCLSQDNVPKTRYYISTGIYRCTTLDIDTKFCENF